MSTRNKALQQFKESVAYATGYAPDGYHAWDAGGYSTHREELARFWSDARHFIVHDLAHAESIDTKLAEALTSFDRGEREPGRSLMFEIYNILNLNSLR